MEILKLYSPLEFNLINPFAYEELGEFPDDGSFQLSISHQEAAEYIDLIEHAFRRDRETLDPDRGMAEYLDEPLSDKVLSLFPGIDRHFGLLWCVAECELAKPLDSNELHELKSFWFSQLADGWGEGFEQRGILVGKEELYVIPWTPEDSFFVATEHEFLARLGVDQSQTHLDEAIQKRSVIEQLRDIEALKQRDAFKPVINVAKKKEDPDR